MKTAKWPLIATIVALFAVFILQPATAQDEDAEPPSLVDVTFSSPFVDVTNGAVPATVTLEATDDLSGIKTITIEMMSPIVDDYSFTLIALTRHPEEGTPRDGVWQIPVEFPQHLVPGVWDIRVRLEDSEGRDFVSGFGVTSITVVNNGTADLEPPTIHNITVTPATIDIAVQRTVEVAVELSDDAAGVWFISHIFDAPSGRSSNNFGAGWFTYDPSDKTRKIYQWEYTFPGWAEEGIHTVSLPTITDRVSRYTGATGSTARPYPLGSSVTVDITNANADSTPPTLEGFSFSPETIDVGYGPATVSCSVDFSDDKSGIRYAYVQFFPPSGENAPASFFLGPAGDLVSGTRNAGRLEGTLTIPAFSEPGTWTPRITLSDSGWFGQGYGGDGEPPLPAGSPTLTVNNAAGVDSEDPEITSLSVTPQPVDVSSGPQDIAVTVGFSDDYAGLERIRLTLRSPDREKSIYESFNFGTPTSGTSTNGTQTFEVQIPGYTYPGEWEIDVTLYDRIGNFTLANDLADFPDGVSDKFTIVNTAGVDLDPPTLHSLEFLAAEADITGGQQRVDFRATITDALAGFQSAILYLVSPTELSVDQAVSVSDDDFDPSGAADSYFEDIPIDPFVEPGDWLVAIIVRDNNGNDIRLGADGDAPLPAGIPTTFRILNSGPVDLTPPEVTNVTASADSFDVTNSPGFLRLEFDFADDVAGLSRNRDIQLSMRNTSTFTQLYFYIDPEAFVSGTRLDGQISALIEIPRYLEPGTWEVELDVRDESDRRTVIDEMPAGTPWEITIVNSGPADTSDPILTGLSMPSSPIDVTSGPQTIPVALQFTDDLAGVNRVFFQLRGPGGARMPSVLLTPEDISVGDSRVGIYEFEYGIPQFSPPGKWYARVSIYENAQNNVFLGGSEAIPGLASTVTIANNAPPSPYHTFLDGYRSDLPFDQQGYLHNPDGDPYPNLVEAALGLDPSVASLPGGLDPNPGHIPVTRFESDKIVIEFTPSELTQPGTVGSPLRLVGKAGDSPGRQDAVEVAPQAIGGGRFKVEIPIIGDRRFLWLEVTDPNSGG